MKGTFFLPRDFYNVGFPRREGEGDAEEGRPLLLFVHVFPPLHTATPILRWPDNTDHVLCTLRKAEEEGGRKDLSRYIERHRCMARAVL